MVEEKVVVMKRALLVFLVLVVLVALVVSGCKDVGFGRFGKRDQQQPGGAFIGGTKGLEVGFAEGQPPASVLDNSQEEFLMTLLVRNSGEFTVPRGGVVASLSGIERSSFGLSGLNVRSDFELPGAAKEADFVVPGGEEVLEFGSASFRPDLPGEVSYTVRADVCYAYKTRAVAKVCLKRDVLSRAVLGEVCQVANKALVVENSGAPVQVVSARESTVGSNKVRLSFKVQNKDVGAVFAPGTFSDACVGHEEERDRVKVTVFSPQNSFSVVCAQFGNSNSGVVKLVNKEKEVSCTIGTSGLQESTFQDVVLVELEYQYRQGVTVPLRVVNSA